jgi:hypothetical protein
MYSQNQNVSKYNLKRKKKKKNLKSFHFNSRVKFQSDWRFRFHQYYFLISFEETATHHGYKMLILLHGSKSSENIVW